MKQAIVFSLLFLIVVLATFINGVPFIFGDGYGYYHVGKNIVEESSFTTKNTPEYYPYTGHAVTQDKDKFITTYPPGNAILWWPFLTVSKFFDTGTVYTDYYKAFNGHSIYDGIAVLLASALFSFLSLIIIYKILKRLGFTTRNSIFSLAAVYLSSYAFVYATQFPSYSHTYEIFACSALLYSIIKFGDKFQYKFMLLAGMFAGLLVLIRPFDLLIVIPITLYVFIYRNGKARGSFILGAIPTALIYLIYNFLSYGSPFKTGYGDTATLFNFNAFFLDKLLLSDVRGWFIYSPVMFLALGGLFFYSWRNKPSIFLYLSPAVLTILGYSFWINWWAGDSLGQRFFLVLVPFMAIGLAHLVKITNYELRITNFKVNIFKTLLHLLIIILSFWSFVIMTLYRITPTDELYKTNEYLSKRYPEVTLAERFTPFDIISYHTNLVNTYKFGSPEYSSTIRESFNGGRSLLLLALGQTDPLLKVEKISETEIEAHLFTNNFKEDFKTNLIIGVEVNSKYISFELNEVNFNSYPIIRINCVEADCSTDYTNAKKTIFEIKPNGIKQVEFSETMKLDFQSVNKVNFVDYKLK
jgi:hypothetical protein